MMELRWTQEAAADLERIADYLFEHTPDDAERLVRALYEARDVSDVPESRKAWQEGGHTRARHVALAVLKRGLYGARGRDLRRPHPARGAAVAVTGRRVLRVQSGARRHGIVGIHGIGGNVESATYRI